MQTSFRLSMLLLGPLFYAQGFYVRRVIPRLPEADGRRQGISGSGQAHRLLILGDSAAAGVGVSQQQQALSGKLVAALESHFQLHWKLLATSGDTSAKVIERLRKTATEEFDTVVISVGANDVNALVSSGRWLKNIATLTELLKTKFSSQHIIFSSLPPMHRFPALPQPLRWWLGLRAQRFNRLLENYICSISGCSFGEIPYTPAGDLVASDGFHPGPKAYVIWGNYMAELITERQASSS